MYKKYSLVIILFLLFSFKTNADIITSVHLTEGYNNNIFNDSYRVSDIYSTLGGNINLYPTSFVELAAYGDYTYFNKNSDLSNFNGMLSLTVMPISDSSNFSLLLHTSLLKRKFGTLFNVYDNDGINSNINLYFKASNRLTLKSTAYYSKVSYSNSSEVSDEYLGASGGLNFTLGNSNALDFETFIYRKKYNPENSSLAIAELSEYDFVDYKLNFSRPLGNSVGISLNYNYHNLISYNDFNIPGYTVDYLSPWSTLWNGHSISFSLKHILKNQSILELNSSYTIKDYVNNIEYSDEIQDSLAVYDRSDKNTVIELKYYKKFVTEKYLFTPTLIVSLTNNSSSVLLYDYNMVKVSFSTSLSF